MHNRKLRDYVTLKPLDVWYRCVYSDNSYFDYEQSLERTIANMKKLARQILKIIKIY